MPKKMTDEELDSICDKLMANTGMGYIAQAKKTGEEMDPMEWKTAQVASTLQGLVVQHGLTLDEAEQVVRRHENRKST